MTATSLSALFQNDGLDAFVGQAFTQKQTGGPCTNNCHLGSDCEQCHLRTLRLQFGPRSDFELAHGTCPRVGREIEEVHALGSGAHLRHELGPLWAATSRFELEPNRFFLRKARARNDKGSYDP